MYKSQEKGEALKVLQVLSRSAGGIRQHVASLNKELNKQGIESYIIGPTKVMDDLEVQTYSFKKTSIKNPLSFLDPIKKIKIISNGFDVIHAHGLSAGYFVYLTFMFKKNKPLVILTMHNHAHSFEGKIKYTIKKFAQNILFSKVDQVICPSKFSLEQLQVKSKYKDKFSVILPIGQTLDEKRKEKAVSSRQRICDNWSIKRNDKVYVSIARLHPQKNLPLLIDAFSKLTEKNSEAKLFVVGSGTEKYKDYLEKYVKASSLGGKVFFTGYVDVFEILSIADVMVLSSEYETVPLVLIESLFMGVPVVMSKTGIANEVLNGENGEVIEQLDSQFLCDTMIKWGANVDLPNFDRSKLSETALKLVDTQNNVSKIIKLYKTN
ncbi:MAG: glycosyltransferase family 4 protein [Acidimicrobiia bacterium]